MFQRTSCSIWSCWIVYKHCIQLVAGMLGFKRPNNIPLWKILLAYWVRFFSPRSGQHKLWYRGPSLSKNSLCIAHLKSIATSPFIVKFCLHLNPHIHPLCGVQNFWLAFCMCKCGSRLYWVYSPKIPGNIPFYFRNISCHWRTPLSACSFSWERRKRASYFKIPAVLIFAYHKVNCQMQLIC